MLLNILFSCNYANYAVIKYTLRLLYCCMRDDSFLLTLRLSKLAAKLPSLNSVVEDPRSAPSGGDALALA